jgi:hypothetical protein
VHGEHLDACAPTASDVGGPVERVARLRRAVKGAADDSHAVLAAGKPSRGDRDRDRRSGQYGLGDAAREHPT